MLATAQAHSNIALIKYWGKRDSSLNLPAVGSISITLQEMKTISRIQFDADLDRDRLILNDRPADEAETARVSHFLDLVRQMGDLTSCAEVRSTNNFPTGAGLASSASAFASLALAATRAAGLQLPPSRLSELARRGSGSAARSIFGGFVEMKKGKRTDGTDAVAVPLADKSEWDLWVLIAITSEVRKKTGSTEGMNRTALTAPYYSSWVRSSVADLAEMRRAIISKDFTVLGELSEFSCLKMHALAMSARPGLLYWNGSTVDCIHAIRELRKQGTEAYVTIDAGPQVKVICRETDRSRVKSLLESIPGVKRIIPTALGPGASLVENSL